MISEATTAIQAQIDTPTAERETIIDHGYILDAETGEVLGMAGLKPTFQVNSMSAVKWVMQRMLTAESKAAAVDKTQEVIRAKAIVANAEKVKKEQLRKLAWLHWRFDNELGEFARQELARTGGKKPPKTLKTLWGSIQNKIVPGGVRCASEAQAIEFAKIYAPDAVKVTEEFRISQMPKELMTRIEARMKVWTEESTEPVSDELFDDETLTDEQRIILQRQRDDALLDAWIDGAFRLDPDTEKVYVKTGVEK